MGKFLSLMLFQFVFCINCTVSFCKPCKFVLIKSWLLYAHIHLRVGSGEILECRNSAQGIIMSQSQLSVEEILWNNHALFFVFMHRLALKRCTRG